MKTRPTENQARRIQRAANAKRDFRLPRVWVVVDGGELIIGSGDTPETKAAATTWEEAQVLVRQYEGR
jgi:hypothetical protein